MSLSDIGLQIADCRLQTEQCGTRSSRAGIGTAILLLVAVLALPGCVTHSWLTKREPEPPAVSQAHAYWKSQVFVVPDPCNGGNPTPFLAGRLYLFGADLGVPLITPGAVTIDLYDATSGQPGQMPLERWNFTKEDLQKFVKKDPIGEGYTLAFPWTTYRPEITRVQLNARFTPEKGTVPVYTPPATVSLRNEGNIPITARQVPAGKVQQAGFKK